MSSACQDQLGLSRSLYIPFRRRAADPIQKPPRIPVKFPSDLTAVMRRIHTSSRLAASINNQLLQFNMQFSSIEDEIF